MKHFSLAIVILAVLATASAQTTITRTGSIDTKALFESHAQMASPFERAAAKEGRSATTSAPGDNAKYVVLRLNTVFPQPGDRLIATLIGTEKYPNGFTITGRHSVYDEGTRQSRAEFFTPRVCGYTGWCPGGVDQFQTFEVYSTQISDAEVVGDQAVDFVIWDENGHLIQQVFAYYYVGRTSEFGRFYFRLEKAEITSVNKDGVAEITLSGRFPVEEQMVLYTGKPFAGSIGPVISTDGRTIRTIFGVQRYEIPLDFVLLFPGMRVASSLPNGVILPQE